MLRFAGQRFSPKVGVIQGFIDRYSFLGVELEHFLQEVHSLRVYFSLLFEEKIIQAWFVFPLREDIIVKRQILHFRPVVGIGSPHQFHHPIHEVHGVSGHAKQRYPNVQFSENASQRPNIHLLSVVLHPKEYFRCSVKQSNDSNGQRFAPGFEEPTQPEVSNF